MLKLIAAAALAAIAVPAAALTVVIDQSLNQPDVEYYTTSQTFTLPTGFGTAKLNIGAFNADDLAIIEVNGTPILGTGIFGPGDGYVYFTATGPSTAYHFAYGNNDVNASFSAPFVAGLNTVTVIVNNNNDGINTGNGPLTGGPSELTLTGTVSATVPEPAAWALMVAGFGLVGVAARCRSAALAA